MLMRPCARCHLREGCEIKAAKLKSIRGLGLTLVNFKCPSKTDSLRPGMKYVWNGEKDYEDIAVVESGVLRGTVMKWNGDKLWVYFPPQDAGGLWSFKSGHEVHMAAVFPDCLTPTGETERTCLHCGLPESVEDSDGWTCRISNGEYAEPLECEYAAAEAVGRILGGV
jgi:hypothetical protein